MGDTETPEGVKRSVDATLGQPRPCCLLPHRSTVRSLEKMGSRLTFCLLDELYHQLIEPWVKIDGSLRGCGLDAIHWLVLIHRGANLDLGSACVPGCS